MEYAASDWVPSNIYVPYLRRIIFNSRVLGCNVGFFLLEVASCGPPTEVIFWLHGSGLNPSASIARLARLFLQTIMQSRQAALVVFPYCLPDLLWANCYGLPWKVEDFIVKELIPLIKREYCPDSSCLRISIHGYSMGGYAALRIAFSNSNLFTHVRSIGAGPLSDDISKSPLADESISKLILDRVFGGSSSLFHRSSPVRMIDSFLKEIKASGIQIEILAGELDPVLPDNQKLYNTLRLLNLNAELRVLPGVDHCLINYMKWL